MISADLLVLIPWLIFGAGLGLVGLRLLGRRGRGSGRDRGAH
ncbi:MAG TPA: hypothetical protein VGI64_22255 [Streptosporangiaceae bacterium]